MTKKKQAAPLDISAFQIFQQSGSANGARIAINLTSGVSVAEERKAPGENGLWHYRVTAGGAGHVIESELTLEEICGLPPAEEAPQD